MYLDQISSAHKELFLDLCIHVSKSDDKFQNNEKLLIKQMCNEMHIPVRYEAVREYNDILTEVSAIDSERTKKIFLLELAGVIMVDNDYSPSEKEYILTLSNLFAISDAEVDKMISLISELYSIYSKCADFIG